VPINVICPHCESRLNLQDDLLGKQMRCPICREIFLVEAAAPPAAIGAPPVDEPVPSSDQGAASRVDAPSPKYQSGSITDFIQVLPTETHAPAPTPTRKTVESNGVPPVKEVVWSADLLPPSEQAPEFEAAPPVKELTWSADLLPPSSDSRDRAGAGNDGRAEKRRKRNRRGRESKFDDSAAASADGAATQTVPATGDDSGRPRKKRHRLAMLALLLLVVFGSSGAGGYLIWRYVHTAPERLYAKAKKEYDKKNFEPARELFKQFSSDHPDDPRAAETRFFAELCALRSPVYSVSVRADPGPALQQLQRFLKAIEDPAMAQFAAPGKFAVDVWETILKLTEEVTNKGNDDFNPDNPEAAAPWIEQAVELGKIVDRFRPPDLTRENVYTQIDALRDKWEKAKEFVAFLATVRPTLAEPDDDKIVSAKSDATARGYATEPAFKRLIEEAESKIAERAGYKRFEQPVLASRQPQTSSTSLLFAPQLKRTPRSAAPTGPPTVFFAQARGILYALDEYDGHDLWATRTGIDADILPLVIRASDLYPELAIVIANNGVHSSITACLTRTGETFWHQPLPSACIGQPVLVGQRLYVPLRDKPADKNERPRRDETGVILEIELASGSQTGKISLGRPLGGPVARRPGTGQLFIPAEAQAVYVFDVDKIGPDGVRLDPIKLGILPAGYAAGSLRGEPIITAGEGDSPGYLILGIADGLSSMKFEAFPLTAADQPPGFGPEPPISIRLAGWTWFSPYADSEKLAVVTDRGEFGLFGIKQAGDLDTSIFVIPPNPFVIPDINTPSRGQIVHADEGGFWFLARGTLHHVRLGFDAAQGLHLKADPKTIALGEPLQTAQVNYRADTALVVTQASTSSSCRATAIDLQTGGIRWQRQLGLIAQGDPIRIGDQLIVMDHDGGFYRIDPKPLAALTNAEWLIDEKWLVAPPLSGVQGSGHFFPARDGQSVYGVLTVLREDGPHLAVRHFKPGEPVQTKFCPLPAPLAGNPIVIGRAVVVPLANNMLHRLLLDQAKPVLEAGLTWRGEHVARGAVCHLAALGEEEFLGSDGGRTLKRYRWPASTDEFSGHDALTLSDKIGAPALVMSSAGQSRLLAADVKGNLTLWDAGPLGQKAKLLQSWRTPDKERAPGGALTNGPFLLPNNQIGYVLGGVVLMRLAPDDAGEKWAHKPPIRLEALVGVPQVMDNRLYITEHNHCRVFDGESGDMIGAPIRLSGTFAPAAAAMPIGDGKLLAPLFDGTLRLLIPEGK
jgi:hypothetical protein